MSGLPTFCEDKDELTNSLTITFAVSALTAAARSRIVENVGIRVTTY